MRHPRDGVAPPQVLRALLMCIVYFSGVAGVILPPLSPPPPVRVLMNDSMYSFRTATAGVAYAVQYAADPAFLVVALHSDGLLMLSLLSGVGVVPAQHFGKCTIPSCAANQQMAIGAITMSATSPSTKRLYAAGATGVYSLETPTGFPQAYTIMGAEVFAPGKYDYAIDIVEHTSGEALLVCFNNEPALVFNVSDPAAPHLVARMGSPRDGGCGGLTYDGASNLIFYRQRSGIEIFSLQGGIAQLAEPLERVGYIASASNARTMAYSKGMLYYSRKGSGLVVVDVSDPASAVEVATCCSSPADDILPGVFAPGRDAYYGMRGSEIIAIDLADPWQPRPAGSASRGVGQGHTLLATDGLFLVAVQDNSAQQWDIRPPPTESPPTPAPPTAPPPPPTPVPATAALTLTARPQDTAGPATATTDTPAPSGSPTDNATTAAPTQAPEGSLSGRAAVADILGQVSGVASVMTGVSGAGAMRFVASIQPCTPGSPNYMSTTLSPARLAPSGSPAMRLVVGNLGLACASALLGYAVYRMARLQACGATTADPQGWARFPSAPLAVLQCCYQGLALGAMLLLGGAQSPAEHFVGFASLLVCVTAPFVVTLRVRADAESHAVYVPDPRASSLTSFILGPGEWVSRFRTHRWVKRHSSVVTPYRPEAVWYSFVEFSACLALAGVMAVSPDNLTGCGHIKAASACILALLLGLEMCVMPYARPRDSAIAIVQQGAHLTSMVFMAQGYYAGNPADTWSAAVAEWLIVSAAILMLLKGVMDLASETYVWATGRRHRLQDAVDRAEARRSWSDTGAVVADYLVPCGTRHPCGSSNGSGPTSPASRLSEASEALLADSHHQGWDAPSPRARSWTPPLPALRVLPPEVSDADAEEDGGRRRTEAAAPPSSAWCLSDGSSAGDEGGGGSGAMPFSPSFSSQHHAQQPPMIPGLLVSSEDTLPRSPPSGAVAVSPCSAGRAAVIEDIAGQSQRYSRIMSNLNLCLTRCESIDSGSAHASFALGGSGKGAAPVL